MAALNTRVAGNSDCQHAALAVTFPRELPWAVEPGRPWLSQQALAMARCLGTSLN